MSHVHATTTNALRSRRFAIVVAACVIAGILLMGGAADRNALARDAVRTYAAHVAVTYEATVVGAETMRAAIRAFCAAPSDASLARARETWIAARELYGRTEAFRFGNGPIDSRRGGVETFLNAWPVDEAYIDGVDGAEAGGIIGNPGKYPALGRAILRLLNQRGGETNVCTGWHAIEFLLWGQDRSESGPGERSANDFIDGRRAYADRRREYLLEITDLLCEDITSVAKAWREGEANYRRRFEADPTTALKAMLTGPALLTGSEMAGERLAVAYETHDQEEEHSCFSDTTTNDFRANMRGVEDVLRGRGGPGLLAVVGEADASCATALETALVDAVAAIDAIPVPFDRAIRAKDGSPERARLKAAITALEALGEQLGRAGKSLGMSIPTEPQG